MIQSSQRNFKEKGVLRLQVVGVFRDMVRVEFVVRVRKGLRKYEFKFCFDVFFFCDFIFLSFSYVVLCFIFYISNFFC